MFTRGVAAAALGAMAAVGAAHGGLVIETGFDSSAGWSTMLIGQVAGASQFLAMGGNPDGHFEASLALPSNIARGGSGILSEGFDLSEFTGGSVRFSLDYQYLDAPIRVPPTLAIAIVQGVRAYLPMGRVDPGSGTSWTRLAETEFEMDAFSNSSGIPLDFSTSMRVAVVGWLDNPSGVSLQTRFKIDNLRIEFVPGVGGGTVLLCGGLAFARRRRG